MNKKKTYLAGSIQAADDGGVGWRDKVSKDLSALGFECQDPTKAECNHSLAETIVDQKKKLENLKRGGSWERYTSTMREIRKADLVCVNNSEFMILYWNPEYKHGGTIHEIVEAWQKHVPIYTVSYAPRMEFNDWVLGLLLENEIDGGKIFPNFKQLIEFLEVEYKDYSKKYNDFLKEKEKAEKSSAGTPEGLSSVK